MRIDNDYLVATLRDLVRINSINPTLAPGGAGEAEISEYVAAAFGSLGLDVRKLESQPGRVSVIGTLRGVGNGKSLMLNAHYDTVGVEGMLSPFSAEIRDGKLYGRGAHDMKASLAAQMAAVKAIVDSGMRLRGDIFIAAVAD